MKSQDSTETARQKRETSRLNHIQEGVNELQQWLVDVVRLGTAELYQQTETYWEERKARMDDAKAPGLSNFIGQLQEVFKQQDWQEQALEELGKLYLLTQTFHRLESLPDGLQAEIKSLVGINVKKETVLAQSGIKDLWMVLGKKMEIQDRLDIQRTWLVGDQSGKLALIIDFAFGNQEFEHQFKPGTAFEAELVYYPGSLQTRALLKEKPERIYPMQLLNGWDNLQDFFSLHAQALSQNPFIFQFPFLVNHLKPVMIGEKWGLADKKSDYIPVHPLFNKTWELISICGQHPTTIFGEWDGKFLYPLGILREETWIGM
ncbi:MAG: hypothetical protein R3B93_12715 [Bacteroidia bacterium]